MWRGPVDNGLFARQANRMNLVLTSTMQLRDSIFARLISWISACSAFPLAFASFCFACQIFCSSISVFDGLRAGSGEYNAALYIKPSAACSEMIFFVTIATILRGGLLVDALIEFKYAGELLIILFLSELGQTGLLLSPALASAQLYAVRVLLTPRAAVAAESLSFAWRRLQTV